MQRIEGWNALDRGGYGRNAGRAGWAGERAESGGHKTGGGGGSEGCGGDGAAALLCDEGAAWVGAEGGRRLISSNGTVTRTIGGRLLERTLLPVETARWLCGHVEEFRDALVVTFDKIGADGQDGAWGAGGGASGGAECEYRQVGGGRMSLLLNASCRSRRRWRVMRRSR